MSIEQVIALATSAIPSKAIDVVGVYTKDFMQVFPSARPMKAEVKEGLKPAESPRENGTLATDHVIYLPTEITMYMFLQPGQYQATYKTIQQLHRSATLLVVQTRTGSYENQIIADMPHTEGPDIYNTITLVMKLHETQTVTATFAPVPADPSSKSTVNRGTVNGKDVTSTTTNNPSWIHKQAFG